MSGKKAGSNAQIAGGGGGAAKKYKDSCHIATNIVHTAAVCVDFVMKDIYLGMAFTENFQKHCFLFCFSPTTASTRFIPPDLSLLTCSTLGY